LLILRLIELFGGVELELGHQVLVSQDWRQLRGSLPLGELAALGHKIIEGLVVLEE